MKKLLYTTCIGLTILLSAFTFMQSLEWKIAEGYTIKFSSKDASGTFGKLKGDIIFDETQLGASSFKVSVDVASINTGNKTKNKHAKSEKWFDAKKYPTIYFTSSTFSKTADGFSVTGTLDMHGVQKEITIPFTFTNNTFNGSITVNRLDYQIGSAEGMSGKVSKELKVDISVPVILK